MLDFEALQKATHEDRSGFSRFYPLLYSIAFGLEAELAFEFGAGFTSKVIVEAMARHRGRLVSCDFRDQSDFNHLVINPSRWEYIQVCSKEVLKFLPKDIGFGLVLHDGSHKTTEVFEDITNIVPRMQQEGVLLVHDICNERYPHLERFVVDALNAVLGKDGYSYLTLPYGGGLAIATIHRNFGHGRVRSTWKVCK